MNASTRLVTVLLIGLSGAVGCTTRGDESPGTRADIVLDDARAAGRAAADATMRSADAVADSTKQAALVVADRARDVASDTAAAVNDEWITAKVKAKVSDEIALTDTTIRVDTAGHVVTLRGTVHSLDARDKAGEIATGTDGVTSVVNLLVVKSRM